MPIHRLRSPARGARRSSIVGGHERVLLAAVDLSPASEAVFDAALDIAHAEPDATIHLLHVRRPADAIPEARAAETLADWAARLPDEGAAIELSRPTTCPRPSCAPRRASTPTSSSWAPRGARASRASFAPRWPRGWRAPRAARCSSCARSEAGDGAAFDFSNN
ncbi:MAG: universal stress protein [Myxococcales bacterium]|nr:universal stress protein [Myxococcales bacterium]